jgi:hypothetical protein
VLFVFDPPLMFFVSTLVFELVITLPQMQEKLTVMF